MKNQYVGDIGDYGKYGLLRFLDFYGYRLGVNWYLTKNDGTSDGSQTGYLEDDRDDGDKIYDPNLFEALRAIAACENKSVLDIEKKGIIENAVFYSEELDTTRFSDMVARREARRVWHSSAVEKLKDDTNMFFADPDNGTLNYGRSPIIKNGEKYAALEELRDYYKLDKDIVYYCHKARRNGSAWNSKMSEFNILCPDAKILVLTYHRGTQRSYIFGIHPERFALLEELISFFLRTEWGVLSVDGRKIPFDREM